jgi:hypothetical protein
MVISSPPFSETKFHGGSPDGAAPTLKIIQLENGFVKVRSDPWTAVTTFG